MTILLIILMSAVLGTFAYFTFIWGMLHDKEVYLDISPDYTDHDNYKCIYAPKVITPNEYDEYDEYDYDEDYYTHKYH